MAEKSIFDIEIEEPKVNINDYTWSFYGHYGFGKSSLCAVLFDDPTFFQWEKGQNALRAKKWRAPDWRTFGTDIKVLQAGAKAGKQMPFKTPIMDTADVAFDCCKDKVCLDNGWTDPSEGEWGKGWNAVRGEFELKMKNLEDLGLSPVYVSHIKDKEIKPKRGEKYDKIMPSIANSAMDTIVGRVDFVGYCVFEKIKDEDGNEKIVRRIYFRSDGDFEAKARLLFFPEFIEYGDSPEEAAYNIRKAFDEAIFKEFNIVVDNVGKLPFASKFTGVSNKEKVKSTKNTTTKDKSKEEKDKKKNNEAEKIPEQERSEFHEDPAPEESNNNDLEVVVNEIQEIFTQLLKDKQITAQKIVSTLKEHVGCSKFGQIEDIEKAKELLVYAKSLQ